MSRKKKAIKYFLLNLLFLIACMYLFSPHVHAEDNQTLLRDNILLLTKFSSKNQADITSPEAAKYAIGLSQKKAKEFIFIGDTENYVYPLDEEVKQVKGIKVIYEDETTEVLQTRIESSNGQSVIYYEDLAIYEEKTQATDILVNKVAQKIESFDLETLLAPYGGRLPATTAFGTTKYVLGPVHVAESNQLDIYDLDYALADLQEDSQKTAEMLLTPFKNYHMFGTLSASEQAVFSKQIEQDVDQLFFAYLYFYRWYGFEIGKTQINDLIYAKSNLFSKENISNEESLYLLIGGFADDPWPAVEGAPWVFSLFQTDYLFNATNGLRSNDRGFTLDQFSDGTISSVVEYLIRILEGTTDYSNWFINQGYLVAYAEKTGIDEIDKYQYDIWTSLKYFEKGALGKKYKSESYNPSIFSIILSMKDKSTVSFAVAPNDLSFVKKYAEREENQQITQKVANDKSAFIKFIWNTGTEEVQTNMRSMFESNWIYISMDTGEFTGYKEKNFYLESSYFLREFLTPLSYDLATDSSSSINGVAKTHSVLLGLNDFQSEYTISHESTHLYQDILLNGNPIRINHENLATMSENQQEIYGWETLSLNYYYPTTQTNGWNTKVPKNNQELQNYTKNFLDLNSAWNIVYAESIFNDIDANADKIYQINYSSQDGETIKATRMSKNEIDALEIDVTGDDFIEKLVKNRIFLPSDTTQDEITLSTGYFYELMPYRQNAFFYVPVAKDDYMKDYPENYVDNFTHFWLFQNMALNGMEGYRNYATSVLGETDYDVLRTAFQKDPSEYLIEQYETVKKKVMENQLIGWSHDELEKAVTQGGKREFIQKYMEMYNNVQDDLFREKTSAEAELSLKDLVISDGVVGKKNSFTLSITHATQSEEDSVAEKLQFTFDTSLEYELEETAKLEKVNQNGEVISNEEIQMTVQKGKAYVNLPDLSYGFTYRLTLTGTPWNNTKTSQDVSDNLQFSLDYQSNTVTKNVQLTGYQKIASGSLSFANVPELLEFETVTGTSMGRQIIQRRNLDWSMTIEDYRGTTLDDNQATDRSDWQLIAQASPFTNADGNEIANTDMGIIFVGNGQEKLLSNIETQLVTHDTKGETARDNHQTIQQWSKEEGFKVLLTDKSKLTSAGDYHATIDFELRTAP